ncbi:hypothetical protein MTO96_022672 [Rhipicephalus appendiculatus]
MDSARSYFTGSRIEYRTPCTSSGDRLCHIFEDLPRWNEFFWQVGLELRELAPGELSLADVRDAFGMRAYVPYVTFETMHEAATLFYHLLTLHRCVVSVDLNEYVFAGYVQLVFYSLCASPSLRRLLLWPPQMTPQTSYIIAAALPHLNHLRELDVSRVTLDQTVVEGLRVLLRSTVSLTTLFTGHVANEFQEAEVLLLGLQENTTIEKLLLCSCTVSPALSMRGILFFVYVSLTKTLRTLSMGSCNRYPFEELPPIMGGAKQQQYHLGA